MKVFVKKYFFILLLCFISWNIKGQDTTGADKFDLKGYMKFLSVGINSNITNQFLSEQYLHNRLEAKWKPIKNLEINAALRTRLFYGELVRLIPNFGENISKDANDYFDLDLMVIDNDNLKLHTVLDRLYIQYNIGKWEIAAGRQRINWGMATLWNPNGIFNTYRFTDFDYEERPGSDALRITWYRKWNSSIELALKMADAFDESVMAARVKFGLGTFDVQGIVGNYYRDAALGGGFAGNLWKGSLRGEFTFFIPWYASEDEVNFSGTIEYQRSTQYDLMYTFGFLYNSMGDVQSVANLFNYQPSAQNLYPYKFSVFARGAYTITPLLSCGLAAVYSINKHHPAFFSPAISYSAAQNFDVNLTGQILAEKRDSGHGYHSPLQAFYLRFKYSF